MRQTNYQLKKEIKRLKLQNKLLNSQIEWLAKQCLNLSNQAASFTYGGVPMYNAPYRNYKDWIQASKQKYIDDDWHKIKTFWENIGEDFGEKPQDTGKLCAEIVQDLKIDNILDELEQDLKKDSDKK